MRFFHAPLLFLVFWSAAALAEEAPVTLDYRLQPGRDLTSESVMTSSTTLRVVEDRGLIARSEGRLSKEPVTIRLTSKQSVRFINGKQRPDGSFAVEMRYLGRRTTVQGADGAEHLVAEKSGLSGMRVSAVLESDHRIRDGSVGLSGSDSAIAPEMRSMMASLLAQMASIDPLVLKTNQDVQQEVVMKLPIPGAGAFDIKMHISNRLLAVENGVASIQQIYSFDFGVPKGEVRLSGDGSGGGSMLYEIASRTLLSNKSGSLMKMVLDTPDGILEFQMDARDEQRMQPTPLAAR